MTEVKEDEVFDKYIIGIRKTNLYLFAITFILRFTDLVTTYMLLNYPCYREKNQVVKNIMDQPIIVVLYALLFAVVPIIYFSSKYLRDTKIVGVIIILYLIYLIIWYFPEVYFHFTELYGLWTGRITCLSSS